MSFDLANVKRVIVHHSASPRRTTDSEDVRRWHIEERAWDDVGYHFVLERGKLRLGRPLWQQGAHDLGQNNDSLAICLMGDYRETEEHMPPRWMWQQLVALCSDLLDWYDLPTEALEGHREHEPQENATDCPGFEPNTLRIDVTHERQRRRDHAPLLYRSEKT